MQSIIQTSGVDVMRINFTGLLAMQIQSLYSSFFTSSTHQLINSSTYQLINSSTHQLINLSTFVVLFLAESISSTSYMIITNASLKILIFVLGLHV
jgi:hypothetical protein